MAVRYTNCVYLPQLAHRLLTATESGSSLAVSGSRVHRETCGPKRGEVTVDWRKLHNGQLHDLYCSPNIISVITSRCDLPFKCTSRSHCNAIQWRLDIRQPRCSVFLPFVITHLNNIVTTLRDWFRRIRIRSRDWSVGLPHSPATVQVTLSSVKLSFIKRGWLLLCFTE